MFTPTHVAEILTAGRSRHVALQRTHKDGALEVYRDVQGREFLHWPNSGTLEWVHCLIRRIAPNEPVPSSWLVSGAPRRREGELSLVG